MARSIPEIQAALAAARQARPELAGLTSPSATSLYRLIEFVVAVAHWAQETLWDRFRAEVDALIAAAPAGTPAWYAAEALKFQAGDPLVVLPTGRVGYADPAPPGDPRRVVARSAVKEDRATGKLVLKVAQRGAGGQGLAAIENDPAPQGPQLYTQVRDYIDRIKFAGTRLEVVSRAADRLRLHGTIYYDGVLDQRTVRAAVLAALDSYLANLAFDGVVYVSRLVDALQAVDGVRDVDIVSVIVRANGVDNVVRRAYETSAGYVVAETTPGYTPADLLTFLPFA